MRKLINIVMLLTLVSCASSGSWDNMSGDELMAIGQAFKDIGNQSRSYQRSNYQEPKPPPPMVAGQLCSESLPCPMPSYCAKRLGEHYGRCVNM